MIFREFNDDEILPWYKNELLTSFALQECKPLEDIISSMKAGCYELWGLFDNDIMLGYAALWTDPSFPLVLIDYLGVSAKYRNGGLGSEILRLLKAQGRPIVLESEEEIPDDDAEENALRKRRIGFYIRNGFKPVYRMAACGFAFQALIPDEVNIPIPEIMRCHRLLYGAERTDVAVPLPIGQKPAVPDWVNDTQE